MAATKSFVSLLETAGRRARRDLARRLDVALAASGEILDLLPDLGAGTEDDASGAVTVGYVSVHGTIGLTAELALIGLCDGPYTRSFGRDFAWMIQAARPHRCMALPAGQAVIELDAPRATTRVWAATDAVLFGATCRVIAAILAGADPATVDAEAWLGPIAVEH